MCARLAPCRRRPTSLLLAAALAGVLGIERELSAAGIGMRLIAGATTAIALLTPAVLRPLRAAIRRFADIHVEFEIQTDRDVRFEDLVNDLDRLGVSLGHVEVDEPGASGRLFTLVARLPKRTGPERVAARLTSNPHVHAVNWTS